MTKLADLEASPLPQLNATKKDAAHQELQQIASEHKALHKALQKALQNSGAANNALQDFLFSVYANSPFLAAIMSTKSDMLLNAITKDHDKHIRKLLERAKSAWLDAEGEPVSEAELMLELRDIRKEVALSLALYDLAKISTAEQTTIHLSAFASAALSASINHLLRQAHDSQKLILKNASDPSQGSGLFVLGMGKLGAQELNYSSDIDVIIFFDPDAGIISDQAEATDIFAKMVRRLVHIMQHFTKDGYVFRTDLRLRPDPGSTPLAFPITAALNYYEGRGQNWERAAYIKARTVAGDLDAGAAFLDELQPFIFRKYLDFAAISDIHSIKRQIHAHRGLGDINLYGHNVKLGRGGIREIEFFVQTQQLIAGGRNPNLRTRRTDEALDRLVDAAWLDEQTASQLKHCYWYLRDLEHRIQMVNDQQTHELPENKDDLKVIASLMGEPSIKSLEKSFTKNVRLVEKIYADLFEQEQQLTSQEGNLSFTGEDDDPDTLRTLQSFGYRRPTDILRIVRSWHRGRYRATQTIEAREILTELTPNLLQEFGKAKDPDETLIKFDAFLSGLPAGIQLFSLLSNNPALLSLLQTIMTSAPRMADIIAQRPHIFDGLLDPSLLSELPTSTYLQERLDGFLRNVVFYEDLLDRLRIFASEQRFLIGIRLLTGAITSARAGLALSDVADIIIAKALKAVCAEMEQKHGVIEGGAVCVLGMGKIASHEMTAGSDIDLIVIYDHDKDTYESDGDKPLDPARYYTRLTQRLVSALSAPTAEGVLYEVDLRLRPSGNKGPVATSLRAFAKYQSGEAWVWEHMALSRARTITGDKTLCKNIYNEIDQALQSGHDHGKLVRDILDMRKLMDKEKPPSSDWDFKLIPGGLVDIEFIVQYLSLKERMNGWQPSSRETSTSYLLKVLAQQHLPRDMSEKLAEALKFWTCLSQITKLCIEEDFEPKSCPEGLNEVLLKAVNIPDLKSLKAERDQFSKSVRAIFKQVVRLE